MNDLEIKHLKMAKEGDVESFEKLIEKYQKKIYNIALRMVNNPDDASELAQEVLVKIFRSIKDFKEESSISTWIYRITTNVCLDQLRRMKNKKTISIDESLKIGDNDVSMQFPDNSPTPSEAYEKKEIQRVVGEAIMKLPEDQRLVVIMKDIQGFKYDEIAEYVKCPEGTVKSRINRARHALKEILKDHMELFNRKSV